MPCCGSTVSDCSSSAFRKSPWNTKLKSAPRSLINGRQVEATTLFRPMTAVLTCLRTLTLPGSRIWLRLRIAASWTSCTGRILCCIPLEGGCPLCYLLFCYMVLQTETPVSPVCPDDLAELDWVLDCFR